MPQQGMREGHLAGKEMSEGAATMSNQTDLFVPCVRCGMPAAAHGEHHARGDNLSMGKGMGGAQDHLETVAFCRSCHRGLQEKEFTAKLFGDIVCTYHGDVRASERAMVTKDE